MQKSKMPQIQGIEGSAQSNYSLTLDNAGRQIRH
jgi:hypothetical protein